MTASHNPPSSGNGNGLLVANLNQISLEKLVRCKLEVILRQHEEGGRVKHLYDQVMAQVEKSMIELALQIQEGNQIRAAELLGINRNTLRKKMTTFKIKISAIKKDKQLEK